MEATSQQSPNMNHSRSGIGHRPLQRLAATVVVVLAVVAASCAGESGGEGDAESVSPDADHPSADTKAQTNLWEQDACGLLSDEEVAAIVEGLVPTESQSASLNSVAADGYGGSSCRWKVSVSQFVQLDVYPSAEGRLDELAAYDPQGRWAVETYSGVGNDARLVVATGAFELETAGTIQALVVDGGDVGIRIALTDKYPAAPDGLAAAADRILAQR